LRTLLASRRQLLQAFWDTKIFCLRKRLADSEATMENELSFSVSARDFKAHDDRHPSAIANHSVLTHAEGGERSTIETTR
jgi:hypothetical protein